MKIVKGHVLVTAYLSRTTITETGKDESDFPDGDISHLQH